jgi:carotenoid cleavage dioxygenase-like enzyme
VTLLAPSPLVLPTPVNHHPVRREVTGTVLEVTGRLPAELTGCLARIGPNPLRPSTGQHAFAGEGMIHGVRLRDGQALWYRNRWVRSGAVSRSLAELPLPGPCHGVSDNANANLIQHAGRILALGEAGVLPVELDDELNSLARFDFDATLAHGFTAHPQQDPVTGELFGVAYYHELSYVEHIVVAADGRVRRCVPIEVTGNPMMHSVALTSRHTVLFDLPVIFDAGEAAAGSRFPYTWAKDRPARLGLLPREGSAARWVELDPCFVFHPVNAFESGDECVIDVIRHDRVFDRVRRAPGESVPSMWRWRVSAECGVVACDQLSDFPQEFPAIDERRRTMPYRYAYTVAMRGGGAVCGGSALLKHDLVSGETQVRDFGPSCETGEMTFVPRHALSAEDDGWLLGYVFDQRTCRSRLVVLDAQDFTGPPVAQVGLPVRVPTGFHTTWLN